MRIGTAGPRARAGLQPDAEQPDGDADVRDAADGVAEQRGGALEPAGQEELVRSLAESPPELTAEMRRREVRSAGERRHVERRAVARVDEVLRAQEVPGRWDRDHRPEYRRRRRIAQSIILEGKGGITATEAGGPIFFVAPRNSRCPPRQTKRAARLRRRHLQLGRLSREPAMVERCAERSWNTYAFLQVIADQCGNSQR